MEQELVSVIMPTHNASKFVAGSIESILNQTYSNLELLITDDGSTDKRTIDIINNFSLRDSRVKVMLLNGNHGGIHPQQIHRESQRTIHSFL